MHVRIARVNGHYRVWRQTATGPKDAANCADAHEASVYANQLSDIFGVLRIVFGVTPRYPLATI